MRGSATSRCSANYIATGYLTDAPAPELRAAADRVIAAARKALGTLYMTKRASDGAPVEMIRTIWSFTYLCPACGGELVFYKALSARGGVPQRCPTCGGPFARRSWPRGEDVPVEVVVHGENGRQVGQAVGETDRSRIRAALKDGRLREVPSLRDRERPRDVQPFRPRAVRHDGDREVLLAAQRYRPGGAVARDQRR